MHTAIYSVYYQNKNTYNVNILVIADAISLVLARKSPFQPVKKKKSLSQLPTSQNYTIGHEENNVLFLLSGEES